MVVVLVGLGVVLIVAIVVAVIMVSRLKQQRALVLEAEEVVATRSRELAAKGVALERAERLRAEAGERAEAAAQAAAQAEAERLQAEEAKAKADADRLRAEQARAMADDERAKARQAAAIAEAAVGQSKVEAERANAEALAAAARAAAADQRAAEASAIGVDPHVLWALERARSERRWKLSVAIGPDRKLNGSTNPLIQALHVELDAIREEVGTIVALDAELPPNVTAAGSLITLRATQELLASVVRRSDTISLRVRADGADILVTIEARNDRGEFVEPLALQTPPSLGLEPVDGGVRVVDAILI
ncbi:MAG: hypothetical protein JWM34_835 [Ilumatobacteraceae bacterium]|nr:hypothetical protein [Ilumatobacteraceae bacterium]